MKNNSLLLGGISLLLFACSVETYEFDKDISEARQQVKLTSQIATRVTGNEWDEGDEIGLYMYQSGKVLSDSSLIDNSSNRKYVVSEAGTLSPATELDCLYYPVAGSVDFIAYYPFANVEDYQLALDVSDQRFPKAIDLLYSENLTAVEPSAESQNLVFEHQMSKIIFSIQPGEGYTLADMEGGSVTLKGVSVTGKFSLVDAVIVPDLIQQQITLSAVGLETSFDATAILIPQSCEDAQAIVSLPTGERAVYHFSEGHEWDSGKQYKYEIVLTKESETESILEAEITNWTDGATDGQLQDYEVSPWDGTTVNTSWYSEKESTMSIISPEELAGLAQLVREGVSFEGKTIVLMNNLDMNGHAWKAIGERVTTPFRGTFQGDNHQIKQLAPSLDGIKYAGLFGISEGVIENLVVDGNCTVSSIDEEIIHVGGVCGVNKGVIRGCRNYMTISGKVEIESTGQKQTNAYVGGLAGNNENLLENSQNYGAVSAFNRNTGANAYLHIGGIAGSNTGTINDCENTRSLTATNSMVRAGGITGLSTGSDAKVEGCTNLGNLFVGVSHNEVSVGGIVGRLAKESRLEYSTNKGMVDVTLTEGMKVYGGGVVASVDSSFVSASVNKGKVTVQSETNTVGTFAAAGGVVGYDSALGTVGDCENYSIASASGASGNYAGGICGFAAAASSILSSCTNGGYPAQWVGNATADDDLIEEVVE